MPGLLEVPVGAISVSLIDDDRVCGHFMSDGFEPESRAAWASMCKPGATTIDVGAYSGLFAIAAAKLGALSVAVEPMPEMIDRIQANAKANGVTVYVKKCAASDTDGTAVLGFNDTVYLTTGASLLRKSRGQLKVSTRRLDSMKLVNVSAIKIDVERAELGVLRGARELLSRDRPKLIVEVLTPEARAAVEALLNDYRTVASLDRRNILMEPL